MGKATLKSILAFSAVLALGAGQGSAKPVVPAVQPPPGVMAPMDGDLGWPAMEARTEPAKEEKTDCDDCVIVRHEGAVRTESWREDEKADPGAPSMGLLASTLWGLFMVSRPKRVPRTVIRGIRVP